MRIEQGRYVKEEISEIKCKFCVSGDVEDESHFMLSCAAYEDLRRKMWTEFETVTGVTKASLETDEQKLNALVGEMFQPGEEEKKNSTKTQTYRQQVKVIMRYITAAMNRRRGQQK